MGFCFMTIEKIKSVGAMASKYKHNYREISVENANPLLKDKNEELVKLGINPDGSKENYVDFLKKRIKQQEYYQEHKVRSNAVLGFEVVTTFSREDNINLNDWKRKNVEWLEKTFNVAKDGRSNIASVMYHGDEAGNVHCHSIIIPIDERGHLNAKRFVDGSRVMSQLQTSYAKDMQEFGLRRGLERSQARHKDIKKYYADLNNSLQLPQPSEKELATSYIQRHRESLETLSATAKRKRDLEYRKHIERMTKEYNRQYEKAKSQVEMQISDKRNEIHRMDDLIEYQRQTINNLSEHISEISSQLSEKTNVLQKVEFYDAFVENYNLLKKKNPEKAQELQNILKKMKDISREKEIEHGIE